MNILEKIPKTLPKENPLLFSFLMILDNFPYNVRFNGKYEREVDKDAPCFEYAVNTWSEIPIKEGDQYTGLKEVQLDIMAAIWKPQPENQSDCSIAWTAYPNGEPLKERNIDASYTYDFEDWRIRTGDELSNIIFALITKGTDRRERYLADIFGWQLVDDRIQYVYAKETTANKYFGVGAKFTLRGNVSNCCPAIPFSELTKKQFIDLGFEF